MKRALVADDRALGRELPGAVKSAVSVLIIDDNSGSLELLSKALAQPGLEILTASNPEEGLDLFCNRRPQIVLTDLVMPDMSGMQVHAVAVRKEKTIARQYATAIRSILLYAIGYRTFHKAAERLNGGSDLGRDSKENTG